MAIITKEITCKTYTGVAVIKAREEKNMSQGKLATTCDWSTTKQQNCEMLTPFLVIPAGYKHISQADFDILQEALK